MDEKSHLICPIFPFIYFINNFYPLLMCTTKLIPYQIACGFRNWNWNWHHHFPFIVWLVKKIYGLGANWKITESIFFLCKICNKGFHIFPGLVLLIHYIQVTMNLHCKYVQFLIVSSFHCNLAVRFTLIALSSPM